MMVCQGQSYWQSMLGCQSDIIGHVHIFVPSWDCTGPHEATIRGSSKALLHHNKRFRDLGTAVWTFWMQILPSSMLPGAVHTVRGTEYLTEADDRDPAFWAGEVYNTKTFLKI